MYTAAEIDALLAHFGDAANISADLKDEMAFAFDFGLTVGNDYGNLDPLANLTRIQGAVMLIRAQAKVPPAQWTAAKVEITTADKAENLKNLPLLTDAQISTITDNYRGRLGALRAVDDQVGKIARNLKKSGEFKNTYFIFTSDNGYMQGEHRLRSSKFLPYEDSARIPALIAGPGIKKNRTINGPAMDVDLTATIIDMAGAKRGRTMDGISLLPALRGKRKLPQRDLPLEAMRPLFVFYTPITAFDLPYYGVRTDRYKYIHWSFDTNNVELYDLKKDPDELDNLANDPAYAATVAKLEAEATRLRSCRGNTCR